MRKRPPVAFFFPSPSVSHALFSYHPSERIMHGETFDERPSDPAPPPGTPWYKTLTRYHWFVLGVAALGWLFDCLDQQLFVLARPAPMKELVSEMETPELTSLARRRGGDIATSIFIAG